MIEAVIFDLGGVIFDSPLPVIADYERSHGIEVGTINRVVTANAEDGAWALHERGELDHHGFSEQFGIECRRAGAEIDVDEFMDGIERAFTPRVVMLAAVVTIRGAGLRVAALTNNWEPMADGSFKERFDLVVESSVEGVRKPSQEIYDIVVSRLGIDPANAVFLDDVGANLKPARAMGMTTIKVVHARQALDELSECLGIQL